MSAAAADQSQSLRSTLVIGSLRRKLPFGLIQADGHGGEPTSAVHSMKDCDAGQTFQSSFPRLFSMFAEILEVETEALSGHFIGEGFAAKALVVQRCNPF